MTVTCPSCGWSKDIPTEKIPAEGAKGTCPKCQAKFEVNREEPATESIPVNPTSAQRDTKPCPLCGKEIHAGAIKCKHCEKMLYVNVVKSKTEPDEIITVGDMQEHSSNINNKTQMCIIFSMLSSLIFIPWSKLPWQNIVTDLLHTPDKGGGGFVLVFILVAITLAFPYVLFLSHICSIGLYIAAFRISVKSDRDVKWLKYISVYYIFTILRLDDLVTLYYAVLTANWWGNTKIILDKVKMQ